MLIKNRVILVREDRNNNPVIVGQCLPKLK